MKITEISKVLENLQREIAAIEESKSQKIVSVLRNVVENLVSDNIRLRQENQELKDVINVLKGAQGKPNIRANASTNGDISSEQERKQAENSREAHTALEGFKFAQGSLDKLKEQRIPPEFLNSYGV